MVRLVAGAVLILLALSAHATQQPSPPKVETFSAAAHLVLVDFVVTDKSDRVVAGLSAKDFVVKEEGKERPIVTFVAFGGEPPQAPEASALPSSDPARNAPKAMQPVALTVTVILVDDSHLTPEMAIRLKPSLKALLSSVSGRRGGLALFAPWSGVSVAGALPEGGPALASAVDQIQGQRMPLTKENLMSDAEAIAIDRGDRVTLDRVSARRQAIRGDGPAMRQQITGEATEIAAMARRRRLDLYRIVFQGLDWLATKSGRRSLIMVSEGFSYDPDDLVRHDVLTRSLQVNAPVHYLDVRGLPGLSRYEGVEFGPALDLNAGEAPFAWSDASKGAASLAHDTGGIVVQNTNDMAKGLGRMLDTMKTYYVLGYEPPSGKAGFRKIKVEVRRKDLKVLARRGYVAKESPPSK